MTNTFYLKLKYIIPGLENPANPVSEELKSHFQFQQEQKAKINSQGDVFFLSGDYENTIHYFDELEKRQSLQDKDSHRKRGLSLLKVTIILHVKVKSDFLAYFDYCQEAVNKADSEPQPSLYHDLLEFYTLLNEKSEEVLSIEEKLKVDSLLTQM